MNEEGSNVGFERIPTTYAVTAYIDFLDATPQGVSDAIRAFYLTPQLLAKLNASNVNGLRIFFGLSQSNEIHLVVHMAFANDFSTNTAQFNVVDGNYVVLKSLNDQPTDFPPVNQQLNAQKNTLINKFRTQNISLNKAFFIHKALIRKICKKANQLDTDKGLKIFLGWQKSQKKLHLIAVKANNSTAQILGRYSYTTFTPYLGGPTNTRPCPPYGGCNADE